MGALTFVSLGAIISRIEAVQLHFCIQGSSGDARSLCCIDEVALVSFELAVQVGPFYLGSGPFYSKLHG